MEEEEWDHAVNHIDEWEPLEEGGMHLVFTDGTRILRINKEEQIERSWSFSSSSWCAAKDSGSCSLGSAIFQQLCNHLSPYTDIPKLRKLSRDDIMYLNKRLVLKQQQERQQQHNINCVDRVLLLRVDHHGNDEENDWTLAMELPDYRQPGRLLWLSSNSFINTQTLSLEIKPKAGYTAISPLVHKDRLVKYSQTRFALQQQLYELGMVRKRWMMNQDVTSTSLYNPLELFSGETKRIRNAIYTLFHCSQNNLKVWKQGSFRIMASPDDDDDNNRATSWLLRNAESVLFNDRDEENDTFVSEEPSPEEEGGARLLDIVTTILCREPFLDKILQLQKLDVIDADGAIIIYERLVQTFCNGCAETAEAMVNTAKWRDDQNDTTMASAVAVIHDVLRNSPILYQGENDDTSRIRLYCDHVQSLQKHMMERPTSSNPSLEHVRLAASRLLNEFQSNDCCYLLRCWLLSLAMCDLSFFVTLHRVNYNKNDETSRTECLQTATSPGCLVYHNEYYFEYELKCIDYDYKPAKKLRSRKEKENLINDRLLT